MHLQARFRPITALKCRKAHGASHVGLDTRDQQESLRFLPSQYGCGVVPPLIKGNWPPLSSASSCRLSGLDLNANLQTFTHGTV